MAILASQVVVVLFPELCPLTFVGAPDAAVQSLLDDLSLGQDPSLPDDLLLALRLALLWCEARFIPLRARTGFRILPLNTADVAKLIST